MNDRGLGESLETGYAQTSATETEVIDDVQKVHQMLLEDQGIPWCWC